MKIRVALTALTVLISGSAMAKTWMLTDAENGTEQGN